jgi:hypothetical protein
VIGWSAGGVTYWAVSDVDLDALKKFVKLWQTAPASEER